MIYISEDTRYMSYDDDLIKDIVEWDVPNWWRAIQYWDIDLRLSGTLKDKNVLVLGDRGGTVTILGVKGCKCNLFRYFRQKF